MRDVVIKKLRMETESYWKGKDYYSYMGIRIDHKLHTVEFEFDGSPAITSVIAFLLTDKDVKKEIKWAAEEYKRVSPLCIDFRCGMSGCEDYFLTYFRTQHRWAASRYSERLATHIHISQYGKLNEGLPDMFIGDLYEFMKYYLNESLINDIKRMKRKPFKYIRPNYYKEENINWLY